MIFKVAPHEYETGPRKNKSNRNFPEQSQYHVPEWHNK